jgi:ABC-2 type transport system permease protein
MKKFKYLVKYGLNKRVGRKAFLISNIVIAILLILVVNIPTIIQIFSKDEEAPTNMYIKVINETSEQALITDLQAELNKPFNDYQFYQLSALDINDFDEEAFWLDQDVQVVIHFFGTINSPSIRIYSKEVHLNPLFQNQIELLVINYQISNYERPNFNFVLAPDYEDPNKGMMISSITSLLILPMFILITMATQFVGVEVIEEKSTKAIETIISSVPAKLHFLSKITASILFVIIQGALVFVYSLLANLIGGATQSLGGIELPAGSENLLKTLGELLPNWPLIITFALLFMVIGTLFFLVFSALFASLAVTQEDYQQFQSPLMLTMVAGFYITIFAPMANGDGFMKVMSFVPIFAPFVAPVAYASGILSLLEVIIALIGLILFLILAIYIIAPIYKVSILSYDQSKFFKRIKQSIKKAFPKNGKKTV